jgi:tetratricopeptide (TPR) repeat protein
VSAPISKSDAGARVQPHRRRHLNPRAAAVLVVLTLVAIGGFFFLKSYQDARRGTALLAEAKELLKKKQPNLALTYLKQYVELNPQDFDALDLRSKVLFDLAHSYDQAMEAVKVHDELVRGDTGHQRPDARRRLVQLNLLVGRIETAHTQALELLQAKTHTAEDYRLAGRAAMVLGLSSDDPKVWQEAIANYSEAHRLEPGNVEGAASLAYLEENQNHDTQKAVQVLDELLAHAQKPAEQAAARLARYDYLISVDKVDQARAELEQAVHIQPDDPDVLLRAATDALRRGNTEDARRYVEAIPADKRNEMQLALIGEIDRRENKIDSAIQDWREGLKFTGGTSDTLTWQLAYVLLRLKRIDEARPLIEQYHRLTDRAEPAPKSLFLDALLLLQSDQPAKAIDKLEPLRLKTSDTTKVQKIGESESLAADVNFALAQCYEAIGQDRQALEAYDNAAKIVRRTHGLKWSEPWLGAANVLLRANRLDDAASKLEDGLVAIPGDASLLTKLGNIRLTQQTRLSREKRDWATQAKIVEMARTAAPTSVEVIKLQVSYLAAAGQLSEAASLLERATDPKHHGESAELWALRAEVLRQLGQADKALEALDQAGALVGDQASLRIARAMVLNSKGRDKAAFDILTEGLKTVSPAQRPSLLRTLGELHTKQNDPAAARRAYAEWAKLVPNDPQPQLNVLELALAAGDEEAARTATAALEKLGPFHAQIAHAMLLMAERPGQPRGSKERASRLDEADRILNTVVDQFPGKGEGYLLRGQLLELQDKPDEAIAAYRQAREHNAGPVALQHLFSLLAKEKKFEELNSLRAELHPGELTLELEQMVAGIALMLGEKGQVRALVDQVVRGELQGRSTNVWRAGVLSVLGEPKQAEEILKTLIQQKPEDLEPRLAMLFFQVHQHDLQKAAETVEYIRTRIKTDRLEHTLATCYLAIGDLARAREYYKVATQKWPSDQEIRRAAITFYQVAGFSEDAEALLRKVLEDEPEHGWARRELAQLLSARREDPTAWNQAIKLVGEQATPNDTAEDRLVRATVLARAPEPSRRQEAIPILESLAVDSPGAVGAMAHDLLARIYLDAKDFDKAREHAEASATQGSDPNSIAFYAQLLLLMKKPEEASKQVERLARLEPESVRLLELRALTLQGQGKPDQAGAFLEQTFTNLEKAPNGETWGRRTIEIAVKIGLEDAAEHMSRRLAENWPKSASVLASVLARRGKLAEALALCQSAADAGNPIEAGTTASAIISLRPLGNEAEPRLKQADDVLVLALKKQPKNLGLIAARANIKRLQGHYAEAAQLYKTVLAQQPDNPLILNNLAWTLSEDLNQPAEGLARIDTAIKQMGRIAALLDTRGIILTHLGRHDEAITDLEAAAQLDPSAAAFYHLARAYDKAGRKAEFEDYRSRARKAGLSPEQLQPNERAEMERLMKK